MKLSEMMCQTMQLVTLNREIVSTTEIKKGEQSAYFSDSKWSDIFSNLLSRIYDGFNELTRAGKLGFATQEIEKESTVATIELTIPTIDAIGTILSVYSVDEITGEFTYYGFRNLSRTKLILRHCYTTKVYVVFALNFPKFSFSQASDDLDIDFTQDYGITEQILNWVCKYAAAEIQEHIDTYKAYSDKNEVLSEISAMPEQYTIPYFDYVEDSYEF